MKNTQEKPVNIVRAVEAQQPGVVFICTKSGMEVIDREHPRLRPYCMAIENLEHQYTGLRQRGFPCHLLAHSAKEAEQLERAAGSIPALSSIGSKCLVLGNGDGAVENVLLAALLEIQVQRQSLLTSLWDVNKSLAILRREYERVVENFSIATRSFGSISIPGVYLSHHIEPEETRISAAGNGAGLIQRVAILPRGLMFIELHVPQPIGAIRGVLKVNYFEGYTSSPLASWTRDGSALREGWNRFALERSSISDEPMFRIEVEWSGADGDALFLSLGPPSPFQNVNVSLTPDITLSAPLAMRVMSGLPGLVPPRLATGVAASKRRSGKTEIRTLVWHDIKHISQRDKPAVDPGFNLVEARDNLKDVLLHTQENQTTIGVIENLLFDDIRGLSCLVHLAHRDASPTEFAVLVRPAYKRNEEPEFTQWLLVDAMAWAQLTYNMDEPLTGRCDLYLATRPLAGRSSSFGWATFKRLDVIAGSDG